MENIKLFISCRFGTGIYVCKKSKIYILWMNVKINNFTKKKNEAPPSTIKQIILLMNFTYYPASPFLFVLSFNTCKNDYQACS